MGVGVGWVGGKESMTIEGIYHVTYKCHFFPVSLFLCTIICKHIFIYIYILVLHKSSHIIVHFFPGFMYTVNAYILMYVPVSHGPIISHR